jgi:glutathione S-transferase
VADVMYAPVALRFVSYQIEVGPQAASYIAALRADPPLRQWESEARAEPWSIPRFDRVGEPGAGD